MINFLLDEASLIPSQENKDTGLDLLNPNLSLSIKDSLNKNLNLETKSDYYQLLFSDNTSNTSLTNTEDLKEDKSQFKEAVNDILGKVINQVQINLVGDVEGARTSQSLHSIGDSKRTSNVIVSVSECTVLGGK